MSKRNENRRALTRREFVKLAVATGIAADAGSAGWAAETGAEIPRRALGRTGEKISILGLGGYHIGVPEAAEGIATAAATGNYERFKTSTQFDGTPPRNPQWTGETSAT